MELRNKILMLLTSHDRLDNSDGKTGVWLGEMTDPYYEFVDAGFEVTMTSPLGGEPPTDPMSKLTEYITESNRRFTTDDLAQRKYAQSLRLENMHASAFDAVFIPGGHGPLWDLAVNPEVARLLCEFIDQDKPIAAVCHGPAALLSLERYRPGFLRGKNVTAFTNTEETLVMRSDNIPFELETALKDNGVEFNTATLPFAPYVILDENLITGQNPLSAAPAAKTLVELLQFPKML